MRITGGSARGIPLQAPAGLSTRPMTDMAKQAIFNILGQRVMDAVVLDLFAGSGSLGLESLSRGAKICFFVEKDARALHCLQANVQKAQFAAQSQILNRDVFKMAATCPTEKFSLCFFDPPYALMDAAHTRRQCIEFLQQLALRYAESDAMLVAHYRKGAMAGMPLANPLALADTRHYGGAELMFLRVSK